MLGVSERTLERKLSAMLRVRLPVCNMGGRVYRPQDEEELRAYLSIVAKTKATWELKYYYLSEILKEEMK